MEAIEEAATSTATSGRIDTKYACWSLTTEESQACESVVSDSRHSVIYPLPNHYSDQEGQQRGFFFECSAKDRVSAMPIGNDMFSLQCLFECRSKQGASASLHKDALAIFNDKTRYENMLAAYVAELQAQTERPAGFDCICEDTVGSRYTQRRTDERPWGPSVPTRVGIFHAFVRTHMKDRIEHKLFIAVSGHLQVACEELHNLWQDLRQHNMTCDEFVESEECHWLRRAVARNHSRIAYDVAKLLNLDVETHIDMHSASAHTRLAVPLVTTYENDLYLDRERGRVHVSDCAALLRRSENGVLFQMFPSEGFWLLLGPKDYACDVVYGTVTERDRRVPALPARTMQACRASNAPSGHLVRIEGEKWYFPDKQFTHELERLGFNRDDGIVHLMPVVQVVQQASKNG
jgi:hypothetical protein